MKTINSFPAVLAAAAIAGCSSGSEPQNEAEPISSWQPPDAYEFVLHSSCGERSLIGRFRVAVNDGTVTEVEGLDDSARSVLASDLEVDVPTLPDLLEEAVNARDNGAEVVDVEARDDGRPIRIEIDGDFDTEDDETCYDISGFTEAS